MPVTAAARGEDGAETEPLQQQERPVVEAPNDEPPGRAVPKAGQEEDDQQVAHGLAGPELIAAQGM